ncbi:AraC family transcriptional regulator [uncultured Sulfitobacter sp.]|uniref:helix-turn-helix transcriptional regulator n=1 Tax=uncultured Sulfitobacter sp. TaxID=191468 RepID=UPI002609FA0D|nr:AraC family transcriptional regulator [uncultured Sulfitobacter sp.]
MSETHLKILTLAQVSGGQDWRLGLAHDRPHHTLVWITRGQGRMLLDGRRRGVGTHNAVFIPKGALFALDLGRQGMGQAVLIPDGTPLRLPDMARQLRVRDVQVQYEIAGLIETAQREQNQMRPLRQDAMEAYVALMSVWLRRQIAQEEHVPAPRSAAERLSRDFAKLVSARYASGAPMADYAQTLGFTPTHLSRAVKAATGKTAADLLTERVVHAARTLLETTPHPARNISHHLGFGSAAYFTRFMQQHTGQTPSQLRNRSTPPHSGSGPREHRVRQSAAP